MVTLQRCVTCPIGPGVRLAWPFIAIALLVAAPGVAAPPYDEASLPHTADVILSYQADPARNKVPAFLVADFDGDGYQEFVHSDGSYLIARDGEAGNMRYLWQINLPPDRRFCAHPGNRLGVVLDRDGNGDPEIHVVTRAAAGGDFRYQVIDLLSRETVLEAPLPAGEDRHPDGRWDGVYLPVGHVPDADGRGRPGVILVCTVGYDVDGRGVLAVDPRNGAVIWRWRGPNNVHARAIEIADLDGDGGPEIVFFGDSANNLNGESYAGLSDDRSRLHVLSAAGELLWRQDLGGALLPGRVCCRDLDGDGVREVVTWTFGGRPGEMNKLIVWDYARRAPRATLRRPEAFRGVAVTSGPRAGTRLFATGSESGFLARYLLEDGRFSPEQRREWNVGLVEVAGLADVLPAPGDELVVDLDASHVAILDSGLRTVAALSTGERFLAGTPTAWRRSPDQVALVVGGRGGFVVTDLVPRPIRVPSWAVTAGWAVLALVGMGATHVWGYRRGRRVGVGQVLGWEPRPARDPRALREGPATDPVKVFEALLVDQEAELRRLDIAVTLEGTAPASETLCLIARGDLRFVLENLVANAVRAMSDVAERRLDLDVARRGDRIRLRVRDTGHGIPAAERARIADGRTSDRTDGGTGLHRSRDILQLWQGRLDLEASAAGRGTTFVITLPAAVSDPTPDDGPGRAEHAEA